MEHGKKLAAVLVGSFLMAVGINSFLVPADILASGFTGASQLISILLERYADDHFTTGTILLILNVPVMFLGWIKIGRLFTFYSFLSIFILAFFLKIIPVYTYSDDVMLNAVFGGVCVGAGVGLTFKFGSSLGGIDIITMAISKYTGKSVGLYFMIFNALIVISAGTVFGEEKALYTLISIFVSSKVIDFIHTNQEKLTLLIVTEKAKKLTEIIQTSSVRGVTIIPAHGGYSQHFKEVVMVVITRYELYEIKKIIKSIDPDAFVNITETTEVLGFFRKTQTS